MLCPKAVMFDLDDTLAPSLEAPAPQVSTRIADLLVHIPVAIITGRAFPLIEPDFLPKFVRTPHIERFYLFPEAGGECVQWDGSTWTPLYTNTMSDEQISRIQKTIDECLHTTGVYDGLPVQGERYVRKHSMLTLMALGLDVKSDLKYSWDPGNARRKKMWMALSQALPEFDVAMGGATAIDITVKGINKAYGVHWLSKHLKVSPADMLYIGDALHEGGNDAVVTSTGIQTRPTSGPEETLRIIDDLLITCA